MAFLLRTISHSADGREIVRTSKIDDDLLKVGRDPDCDIRLNDLAVALHHATIELVSATRLGISAEMGMTIEIDGHTARDGQIDLQPAATVRIGPFLLRILPTRDGLGRRRDRHRARRGRCGAGRPLRHPPLRARRGDAGQAADGLGPRSASCSPSSSPGRSGPSTRIAARRRATPRAIMPTGCGTPGSLSQGHAGARRTIARPATSSRSSRSATQSCKSCHTAHPRPCRSRPAAARQPQSRRLPPAPADRSAPCSARIRAAASIAIPSMKGRSESRRRRSNSAPIATPTSRRGCPTPASPAPPISRTAIPNSSRRC